MQKFLAPIPIVRYDQVMNFFDDSRDDPPLRAVRAFEATARLGTMAAAAEKLDVSPSAISHQLALLEDFLQMPLFRRSGRCVQLTDAGRRYYRSVRSALAVLRDATEELRDGNAPAEIKLSCIPLFATGWLIPRLLEFTAANPDIAVNITYANHQNYYSDPADLSVRFGNGQFAGYDTTKIASGNVTPFCSAKFLENHGPFESPVGLLQCPLIHDEDRSGWERWIEKFADQPLASRGGDLIVEDGQLATSAANAGLGIALLRRGLVETELRTGRLVQLFDCELDDGRHYFLCQRSEVSLSTPERRMSDWILSQASGSDLAGARQRAP